jgi:hypothetical protein
MQAAFIETSADPTEHVDDVLLARSGLVNLHRTGNRGMSATPVEAVRSCGLHNMPTEPN